MQPTINPHTPGRPPSDPELTALSDFVKRSARIFLDYSDETFERSLSEPANQSEIRSYLADQHSFLLFVAFDPSNQTAQNKLSFSTALERVDSDYKSVILYFKKSEIVLDKILKESAYLKTRFNILNLGKITSEFNLFKVFHECIKNALIPMFNNVKTALNRQEDQSEAALKAQNQVMLNNIFKKFSDLEATFGQKIQTSLVPKIELVFDEKIEAACREAAARGVEPSPDMLPKALLDSKDYINSLSELNNKWVNEIELLANYGGEQKIDSVSNEVNFWNSLYENLVDLSRQAQRPEVKLTIQVLQLRKKVNIMNIESMKVLDNKIAQVDKLSKIMNNLPFNQILLSNDHREIHNEIATLFTQIRKLLELGDYSDNRLKHSSRS